MKKETAAEWPAGQQAAYKKALEGRNLFITGGAGTGKSLVLGRIAGALKAAGKNVALCAPTGSAAAMIGGSTVHRLFGFTGAACINEKTLTIKVSAGKMIRCLDVLIIDEISMCRMDLFDAVSASLRRASDKTGRKIQLIVSGDFCQLPPVLTESGGDRSLLERFYNRKVGRAYAFQADSWESTGFETVILDRVMRQGDTFMTDSLNSIRLGKIPDLGLMQKRSSSVPVADAPWLFPYNRQAEAMNSRQLASLQGRTYSFRALTSGRVAEAEGDKQGLVIKEGARVMLTANEHDPPSGYGEGYHNGSMGTIRRIRDPEGNASVTVRLDTGRDVCLYRRTYAVYKYVVTADDRIEKVCEGSYSQFPLKVAYALTIHKGQGQTYDKVNIDPRCSNPGQLYVALSRVKDIGSMYLMGKILPEYIVTDPAVKVFYEKLEKKQKKKTGEKKSGGRPKRFPNGSCTIRIPSELAEPLDVFLQRAYPAQQDMHMDTMLIEKLISTLKNMK